MITYRTLRVAAALFIALLFAVLLILPGGRAAGAATHTLGDTTCVTSIRFITGVTATSDTVRLPVVLQPGEYVTQLTAFDEYTTPVNRADTDPATNSSERVRALHLETEDLADGVEFASATAYGTIITTDPLSEVTFFHLSDGNPNSVTATLCFTELLPEPEAPEPVPTPDPTPEPEPEPVPEVVPPCPDGEMRNGNTGECELILYCPLPGTVSPTGLVRDCPEMPDTFVEPFECFDKDWNWID